MELGDWTPGRYAWELQNVTFLSDPIPEKGKQGLWNFDVKSIDSTAVFRENFLGRPAEPEQKTTKKGDRKL